MGFIKPTAQWLVLLYDRHDNAECLYCHYKKQIVYTTYITIKHYIKHYISKRASSADDANASIVMFVMKEYLMF